MLPLTQGELIDICQALVTVRGHGVLCDKITGFLREHKLTPIDEVVPTKILLRGDSLCFPGVCEVPDHVDLEIRDYNLDGLDSDGEDSERTYGEDAEGRYTLITL